MQGDDLRPLSLVKAARELLIPGSDIEAIERVATRLKDVEISGLANLKPLNVQIIANITSDYLCDYVRLMFVRSGFAATVQPGHYGGLVRDLLGEVDLNASPGNAAVVMFTHRDIQYPPPLGIDAKEARELVNREVTFWTSLLERSKIPTVVVSFDLPPRRMLDEQDGLTPGGLGWHVRMTNLEIATRLSSTTSLIDAEALQYRVGATQWYDERLYHLCKQPYTMEALPEIAHTIVAAMTGLLGGGRKVLVLDLDNTLWGGVVGDDGLQTLELGSETAEGEAFVAFQSYVRDLSRRGIVLAVCSKNREEVARAPFREHSGMVLKEEDISCFVANFQDKATNLRHIARALNLGLDSFVFVDDNPVERELIRAELPEVLVVELPDEPAYYERAVEASKAFPLRSLTREDLGRVASYRAIAAVQEASSSATDMDQFLRGLSPVAHVEKIDGSTVDRVVQLIRKTNQFKLNLTSFQEAEILEAAGDIIALRLVDRLQDYGIVAVAVAKPVERALRILNWVMSCRVFGRRLENVMLDMLCEHAQSRQCDTLEAGYTPTEKNVILPEILCRLGFETADASDVYHRSVHPLSGEPHYMSIIDRRIKHE
jgi:FkbH-like protein